MSCSGRCFAATLLGLAFLVAGCAPGTPEMAEQLLATDREFASLSERTDPKQAFAAYLAPDAILIPRAGAPIHGREAALASFGKEPAFGLHWQPQQAEVAASGDIGWTWGTYQILVDGRLTAHGKYLNVWKRQADGAWKVRLDIGNLEPGEPPPRAEGEQ